MSDKRFTRAEVSSYNRTDNTLIIIHNNVYDVKEFLDEHPGGHEVLVNVVGNDATEDFDDIGHSLDAKELMKKYKIGALVDEEKTPEKPRPTYTSSTVSNEESFWAAWKLPIILGILATVVWHYLF